IRPISKTVDIFVTGLEAASLSLFASNFGLKSSTGSRNANEGISFISSIVSSFFSTSLLFNSIWCMMFSLVENIWKRTASHIFVALGASLVWFSSVRASGASLAFSSPISGNLGSSCSTTMCFLSRDQPLNLDFIPFGFCMALRSGSAAADFCSAVWTLSLPKSFLTDFKGSWSSPLGRGFSTFCFSGAFTTAVGGLTFGVSRITVLSCFAAT
uniref:Uncharacterized protein n=1 Tax=Dicentrarchus labrax TaxID=13489 RepID=A0A8C4HG42_DICLA